jgi:hypothetical protein
VIELLTPELNSIGVKKLFGDGSKQSSAGRVACDIYWQLRVREIT